MAIHKFKVNVTREFEYLVEIDDTKMDLEFQEEFNEYMYFTDGFAGHAINLASLNARFPDDYEPEGYGPIKINGHYSYHHGDTEKPDDMNINVTLLWEDLTTDCEETK